MLGVAPGISALGKTLNTSFTFQQKDNGVLFFLRREAGLECVARSVSKVLPG
jgi:hypothetical protein